MALGSFKQEETAQMFAQLFARVIKLERQLGVATRATEIEGAEPNEDVMSASFNPQYRYYPIRVNTPDSENSCFTGNIMVPTDSASKVTASSTFTAAVTVDVPANLTMPAANDIVMAFFLGPYAVGKSRYLLGGAAGGLTQCLVNSEFLDYLAVTKVASGTTTGTLFEVAKPYNLRAAPFNNQTVGGVTRVYSSNGTRVASNADHTQIEMIIPRYDLGNDLIYISGVDHSDTFVSTMEIKFLDMNVDGRAWTSGE